MKKIVLYTCIFLLIAMIGYFYYSLRNSPVGPPDSFIQTNEACGMQRNTENTDADTNDVYSVRCNTLVYFIAESQEDLEKYVGKKVRIQAVYPKNASHTDSIQTNQQCIAGTCQLIYKDGRNIYAIIIEKIEAL